MKNNCLSCNAFVPVAINLLLVFASGFNTAEAQGANRAKRHVLEEEHGSNQYYNKNDFDRILKLKEIFDKRSAPDNSTLSRNDKASDLKQILQLLAEKDDESTDDTIENYIHLVNVPTDHHIRERFHISSGYGEDGQGVYESSDLLPNGYYIRKHPQLDGKDAQLRIAERNRKIEALLNGDRETPAETVLSVSRRGSHPKPQPGVGEPDEGFTPHLYLDLCPSTSKFELVNMGLNDNIDTVEILPNTWIWTTRCTEENQTCPNMRRGVQSLCRQKKSWVQAFARHHDNDPWQWHWIAVDAACTCGMLRPDLLPF